MLGESLGFETCVRLGVAVGLGVALGVGDGDVLGIGADDALGVGVGADCVRSLNLLQINFLPDLTQVYLNEFIT